MLIRALALFAFLLPLVLPASQAAALSVSVELVGGETQTFTDSSPGNPLQCGPAGEGLVSCIGEDLVGGPSWELASWNVLADADPFVQFNIALINTSSTTQDFVFTITESTSTVLPTVLSGSIQGGITTGLVGPGTLSDNGVDPIYTALIDGAILQTLYDVPTSVTEPTPFFSSQIAPENFSGVGGPAVGSDISVELRFSLTPGDSASFTGAFNVVPIPEPSTALLVGLGLVGLATVRRQR